MKKALQILFILVILVLIYRYFYKKTPARTLTNTTIPEGQGDLLIVMDIIRNTPPWYEEIKRMAKNRHVCRNSGSFLNIINFGINRCTHSPITPDDMLVREAKRHLKIRGLADIQANPMSYPSYPRPEKETEDMDKQFE